MEVKKLLAMPQALWNRIDAVRWEDRIQSESEAMRVLLEEALDARDAKAKRKRQT
jgi:Arc/MetJ-type ribon-helix-helix transcriptional regulator